MRLRLYTIVSNLPNEGPGIIPETNCARIVLLDDLEGSSDFERLAGNRPPPLRRAGPPRPPPAQAGAISAGPRASLARPSQFERIGGAFNYSGRVRCIRLRQSDTLSAATVGRGRKSLRQIPRS